MIEKPLISICIPTYSRLNYLIEAVRSVSQQQYSPFEVCVSLDPKPTGPDAEIDFWCREQEMINPWFRYQVNSTNLGLAGNWNALAKMARGAYLMIIGDDDTLEPGYLEAAGGLILQTDPDVVFSNQHMIDEHGVKLAAYTDEMTRKYGRDNLQTGLLNRAIEVVLNNSIPMSAALIKRKWLLKYPFHESLNTPELGLFLRISVEGGTFAYVNEKLANYRVHGTSATSGGLKIHYLMRDLIPVEVPTEYEPLKYRLLSAKMVTAVNLCLKSRDRQLARQLLTSGYYPAIKPHYRLVQWMLYFVKFGL